MARDRRETVDREGAAPAAATPSTFSADTPLAGNHQVSHPRDHLLALVRALARDAARADHAAEGNRRTD